MNRYGAEHHRCLRQAEREADRAVIRAHNVSQDFGLHDGILEVRRDEDIVQTPADIARPRATPRRPPAIGRRGGMQLAKGVNQPRGEEGAHRAALFG